MSNGLTIDQLPSYDDTNVDTEEIVLEVEQKTISQASERSRKMKLSEISEEIFPQFEVTVSAEYDWFEEYEAWIAEITVPGIKSTDRPIVDIDLSNVSVEDVLSIQAQWSRVYRIEASDDNEIKLYSLDEPVDDFDLFIRVVR